MYYRHFGLSDAPFQFTVMPNSIYRGREQNEAMAALAWGLLHEPTGYTLLVGEPGTGKSTIVRSVLQRHRAEALSAFINYPKAEPLEMFRSALRQLGSRASQISKFECAEAFVDLLREVGPGQRVALVFDEAQALSPLVFEELRLLGNCAVLGDRRLQVIFIGQPSILKRLEAPMLRQLNQRIGARVWLKPMSEKETLEYIRHRIQTTNGAADQIFAHAALKLIVTHSHGIARRVNVLCHNAMLGAYAAGRRRVTARQVQSTIAEFENKRASFNTNGTEKRAPSWRRLWMFGASVAVASAVGLAGLVGTQGRVAVREIRNAVSRIHPGAISSDVSMTGPADPVTNPEVR
jgi:general secretion pathway protein A